MPKVYRLENSEGRGVYGPISQYKIHNGTGDPCSSDRHPGPWRDRLLRDFLCGKDLSPFSFGFKTKKQLKEWFSQRMIRNIIDTGVEMNFAVYQAKKVVHGEKQVIFEKSQAKLLKTFPLQSIYKTKK